MHAHPLELEHHRPNLGPLGIRLDPGQAFGTGTHPTTR
ncbi:MAG: 50S ribosomal protein L11 methyltransferase, partial [Myxococcota bacterium]